MIYKKKPRFTLLQILEGLEELIVIIACYITLFLKPLRDRWRMNKNELDRSFPGDEYVTAPKSYFTHATKINAPAKYVWSWIA